MKKNNVKLDFTICEKCNRLNKTKWDSHERYYCFSPERTHAEYSLGVKFFSPKYEESESFSAKAPYHCSFILEHLMKSDELFVTANAELAAQEQQRSTESQFPNSVLVHS